jgi:hypothetical protein
MKITSTLTDKELTLIAEPEDFYNFPEDAYRAIADAAATKERERVIREIEEIDITNYDHIGAFKRDILDTIMNGN